MSDLRDYYATAPLAKTYRTPKSPRRIRPRRTPKAERQQIEAVRAQCVERDGDCRATGFYFDGEQWRTDERLSQEQRGPCYGDSEWAHMHARRRSKTRGMAPEYRHDTAHSLMLCHKHHEDYDAKRLIITAITRRGADGPLKFRRSTTKRTR
jgi:hypothetical protein